MNASGAVKKTLSKENLKQSISAKDISVKFSKQNEKDYRSKVLLLVINYQSRSLS